MTAGERQRLRQAVSERARERVEHRMWVNRECLWCHGVFERAPGQSRKRYCCEACRKRHAEWRPNKAAA